MTFLQSILLGLIQGVAEFLPISSSGHLAIAQNLLNINAEVPAFYDVLLHLGTLVAVFVAYWQDICDMVREFFCGIGDLVHHSTPTPVPPARRLILLIILGTLPLFAILPIKDTVEGLKNNMIFIGAALIVTGFLLFFSDRARKGRKDARSATVLDVLVVGVSQAIATVPGISRSGMTITTGCFVGFERRFAVRFSFLLSIPAVLGANILSLKDALTGGVDWSQLPVYLVGVVVAAVSGYLCIRLLKMIADKGRFGAFAYYCWAAGLATPHSERRQVTPVLLHERKSAWLLHPKRRKPRNPQKEYPHAASSRPHLRPGDRRRCLPAAGPVRRRVLFSGGGPVHHLLRRLAEGAAGLRLLAVGPGPAADGPPAADPPGPPRHPALRMYAAGAGAHRLRPAPAAVRPLL